MSSSSKANYHLDPNLDALYRTSAMEALSAYRRTVSDESSSSSGTEQRLPPHRVDDLPTTGKEEERSDPVTVSDAEDSSSATSREDERVKPGNNGRSEAHPTEGITKPGPNDVLCGRGHGANNHPGNVRFRNLLRYYKLRYVAAWKAEKPKVAREVVNVWRAMEPPGRFLIQSKSSAAAGAKNGGAATNKAPEGGKGGPGGGGGKLSYAESSVWHDVGDKRAQEKTSQTLRERNSDLLARLSATVGGGDERQRQVLEAIRRTHRPPELTPEGIQSLSEELDKRSASNAELTKEEIASAASRAIQSLGAHAPSLPAVPRDIDMAPGAGSSSSAAFAVSTSNQVVAPTSSSPRSRPRKELANQDEAPRGSLGLLAIVADAGGEGVPKVQAARCSPTLSYERQRQVLPPVKRRRTEPHSLAPEHNARATDIVDPALLASHYRHQVHPCEAPRDPYNIENRMDALSDYYYDDPVLQQSHMPLREEGLMHEGAAAPSLSSLEYLAQRQQARVHDLLVRRASLSAARRQLVAQQVASARRSSGAGLVGGYYHHHASSAPIARARTLPSSHYGAESPCALYAHEEEQYAAAAQQFSRELR